MTTRLRSRLGSSLRSSSVQVVTSGRVEFNVDEAARIIGMAAVGEIQRNAAAGKTPEGGAMRPYSSAYKRALEAGGEDDNVDLTLTGGKTGLLGDVKWRLVRAPGGGHVEVYVGTGRSPAVVLANGRAKRTGRQGPSHDRLAAWIHYGTGRMPARPWLGLTKAATARIARLLVKAKLFRVGVSTSG